MRAKNQAFAIFLTLLFLITYYFKWIIIEKYAIFLTL